MLQKKFFRSRNGRLFVRCYVSRAVGGSEIVFVSRVEGTLLGSKERFDCDPHRLAELTRSCKRHRLEQTRPHAKRRRHRQRSSTCSSIRMRGALRAPEQGAFHDQRAPPEPRRGPVARVHSSPPSAHSPRASLRLQDLISAGNGRPPLDLLQPSGARRARTRDAIGARGGQSGSAWRLRDRGR